MAMLRASLAPEVRRSINGFSNTPIHYKRALQTIYRVYGAMMLSSGPTSGNVKNSKK
ncbi:Hypothetical protein FKW44_013392 [Caligus rogercresseyi]|uniref:Uncharacterized protein n=1 Tax=Caligus rogercresseyi TaxID=217165 RepID=A0A7T8HM13_CALRO|nr:Hypothetical protein FKW44_013392 [Caligus rogercresseyi]